MSDCGHQAWSDGRTTPRTVRRWQSATRASQVRAGGTGSSGGSPIIIVSFAGILVLMGSAHDTPAALGVSLYVAAAAVLAAGTVVIVVEVRRRRRDPPGERYGSWPWAREDTVAAVGPGHPTGPAGPRAQRSDPGEHGPA